MPKITPSSKPTGPLDSPVALILDATTALEKKNAQPLLGPTGNVFRSIMLRSGIIPEKTRIYNALPIAFPNNVSKYVKLTSRKGVNEQTKATLTFEAIVNLRDLLINLAEQRPNIIVPTGDKALWLLTGLTRISKRRGSLMTFTWDETRAKIFEDALLYDEPLMQAIQSLAYTKIYPVYDPAQIVKDVSRTGILEYDLTEVAKESRTRDLDLPNPDIIIDPEPSRLEELTDELLSSDLISFDIEVVGGTELFCVGFCCNDDWAVTLTPTNLARREVIRTLLESDVPKVAQNGIFDITWLRRFTDFDVRGEQHDTLVAHSVCYPEYPKGLDFIGSIYTRYPYHKDEGKNWNPRDAEDVKRFLEYNAKDVLVTYRAMRAMMADELTDPYYSHTYRRLMSHQPVYERMMTSGIRIDLKGMAALREQFKADVKTLQTELDEHVEMTVARLSLQANSPAEHGKLDSFMTKFLEGKGTIKGGLNVNSTPQMRKWLYEILKLPKQTVRGTSKLRADEDALKTLYALTKDESLLKIWSIREKRKRISSYLSMKTQPDGQMFFSVMPTKTKTGRSACGKTILNEGLNVQTPPHELRSIYIPDDEEHEFAYLDLGQAEARIVAYKGGISRMIHAFENGIDLHKLTASLILDIPMDEIKEYPHRYLGKRCNHAFNYEMGPYKFFSVVNADATKTGISITRSEAKNLRERHIAAYPELKLYWAGIRDLIRTTRTIINPFNRKREFTGRMNDQTFREAFSHYAQSTVADIIRTGMIAVAPEIEKLSPRSRVTLEAHDALLLHYPKSERDYILPLAMNLMEIPINIDGQEITIPVDAVYGPNWQETSKYARPAS